MTAASWPSRAMTQPAGSSRQVSLVALVMVLIVTAAAAQQPTVTLAEAIASAERTQPGLAQASAALANATDRTRSAWAEYLPSLSLSSGGNYSYLDSPSRIDSTGRIHHGVFTNASASLVINAGLDLLTGIRQGASVAAARADQRAAAASLIDAKYQQRLATTNQFFDALAAQQLVRVAEAGLRRAQEQQALAVAKFGAGTATRSDTLRAFVTFGNARLQLMQAEARLAGAEAELGRLVGQARRVRAVDDSTFYRILPALDTAALLSEALARAPRVQAAHAQRVAATASLRATRSSSWPSLFLSTGSVWSSSKLDDYQVFNTRQLNLQLSWDWPLFDRFSRHNQIGAARSALDVAAMAAADAERQLAAALITQIALLEAARANVEITGAGQMAAAEDLLVQQERYRVGLSTIVDVLTSQEALTQAEVNAVTTRFDYLRSRAQLEALLGRAL